MTRASSQFRTLHGMSQVILIKRTPDASATVSHPTSLRAISFLFLAAVASSNAAGQIPADIKRPHTNSDLAAFARQHLGDPVRGRALFMDRKGMACVDCHRARADGGDVGPDLSDVGAKYDRAQLIESVLEPSRQIVEGYRPTVLAMSDGRVVTGLVKSESNEVLELVDAERRRLVVRKGDIEERRAAETSLMPDNLAESLAPDAFADLIAFLASLRSNRQPSPGSDVFGPLTLPPGFSARVVADGLTAWPPPWKSRPTAGSCSASKRGLSESSITAACSPSRCSSLRSTASGNEG